jgi:nucleolar complex protein 3
MPHGRSAKRRRLSPPVDDSAVSKTIKSSDLFHNAADWDLEDHYQQRSSNKKRTDATRLPTINADGIIERAKNFAVAVDDVDSFLGSGSEDDGGETPPTDFAEEEDVPKIPLALQVRAAKEEIARIAALINEDPEEHAGSFKKLAQIGHSKAPSVIQKLALAAQVAVYKDVIPGYRIRAYNTEDVGTKISKEVRQTRQYEQALVSGYQGYIKDLSLHAKPRSKGTDQDGLRGVAISCACALLLAVPHFNFRTELLNIIVRELSGRKASPEYNKCIETMEVFFEADEDGAPSLEAVTLLTKMMKDKDYYVRENVLNTFLKLRLLAELSVRSSSTKADRPEDLSKLHGKKVKKNQLEHRSKKEKKVARDRKAVEKEYKEADATVSHEERDKVQSETLKLVFVCYFRILKAKIPELTGAVLEGLAKYAHLINQDFFGDILEALKDIIGQAEAVLRGDDETAEEDVEDDTQILRDRTRETLLATQTAFTLLSGQDVSKSASALHLDLSFFTSHIYRALYPLVVDCDIEFGPKSMRLPDPNEQMQGLQNKINISTPVLLLTRVLTSILLTPSQPPPTITAATFYKRLLTSVLQTPEKSTIALLHLMNRLAEKHGKKIEALWYSDERKGDGVFNGASESIEGSNVQAVGSGVWENVLLSRHYCPRVREEVISIDKVIQGLNR